MSLKNHVARRKTVEIWQLLLGKSMNNPRGSFTPGYQMPMAGALGPAPGMGMQQGVYPNAVGMQMGGTRQTLNPAMPYQMAPGPSPYQGMAPPQGMVNPGMAPQIHGAIPARQTLQPSSAPGYVQPVLQSTYHIPENQKPRYANLYSLISAIEVIEDEYCNGYIYEDMRNKLIGDYQKQFNTLKNSLNLSIDQIREFSASVNLPCEYTIATLNQVPEVSGENNSVFYELGESYVNLSDLTAFDDMPVSRYLDAVRDIKGKLMVIGKYPNNPNVKQYTDKWISYFESLNPISTISKGKADELAADIKSWRYSTINE